MNYPKQNLKENDYIGVTAISAGLTKENDLLRLDKAYENLEKIGFKIKETSNVRTCNKGRSSLAKKRAEEFMNLWEDEKVKSILFPTGGDFAFEMLDELDLEKIKNSNPKWIAGYSDITTLSFILTTICDIPTIYGPNVKGYGTLEIGKPYLNEIRTLKGETFYQESYPKCEDIEDFVNDEDNNPYKEYKLTKDVKWKSLNNEEKLHFKGRSLGGCFDVITNLTGSKYDNILNYIEKYKNDGIVWFLESFSVTTPNFESYLWRMKQLGYFKYCKGIVFGRPLFVTNDYEITYIDAIKEVLGNLNIPIICDIDLGHVYPQFSIVNGGILEVEYEDGKGRIKNIFE